MQKLAKKDEPAKDHKYEAKMQVLNELRDMAMGMMGDKVKGKLPGSMEKVSVMAPDQEGLKKGLDMAKSIIPNSLNADRNSGFGESLDSKMPHMGSNHSPMDMAAQDVEDQHDDQRNEPSGDEGEPDQEMLNPHDDEDDMTHEEIDSMIQELQDKKRSMKA